MTSRRILLVDDDEGACEILDAALRGAGFTVQTTTDPTLAMKTATSFRPDLALVDLELASPVDGHTVARRLREHDDLPLMFVTETNSPEARLAAFALGADDLIARPFSFLELCARIDAILRRAGLTRSRVLEFEDLTLDHDAHTVHRAGALVPLTSGEFELLAVLMRRPGATRSKPDLLAEIWGGERWDVNLVEVYASSLRRKLERHGPRIVHTVRGVGYVLRSG